MNKRLFLKSCLAMGVFVLPKSLYSLSLKNNNVNNKDIKLMKEAMFYKLKDGKVVCELCPNFCLLNKGELGLCNARINKDSILYSLTYQKPCSVNIDPIAKKPLYHFYPSSQVFSLGTAGCNFKCLNCQNYSISQVSPDKIKYYNLTPEDIVNNALKNNCKSIAYTYSEPTIFYEYMYEIAVLAKSKGIKNVMVSNGYINQEPLKKLIPFMDAANIDLKSFDNNVYKKLNGGMLQPILDTLLLLKKNNVWLEITNLIIPQYTDDLVMIEKMCNWLVENGFENTPLHFSRFFPTYKLDKLPPTPVETIEKAREIAIKKGIKFVYTGNVRNNKGEDTYCPQCDKVLIERSGYIIVENNISKGKCKFCNTEISGIY